jgi:hypothetical protein
VDPSLAAANGGLMPLNAGEAGHGVYVPGQQDFGQDSLFGFLNFSYE